MQTILISTIQPVSGGVPTMLRFILECLQHRGCQVTVAYYQPYSVSPDQSVPFFKLPFSKPSNLAGEFVGYHCQGVGCWLPELEFTHYWATQQWQTLIDGHDVHLTVSGSAMAALPFVQTQTPFLAWVATDWLGDREHRVQQFQWFRRLVDTVFISPITKHLEKRIIRSGNLVALSEHTRDELNRLVGGSTVQHVLSMPIDTEHFVPISQQTSTQAFKVGFVGRFEDPRKHLSLLLKSIALAFNKGVNVELTLVGDELSEQSKELIRRLGLVERVTVIPYVDRQQLPDILQQWHAFVLPSHQEGLCIAALEAMSCGLPIISTRCGGPESYIVDAANGILCDHDAKQLAHAVLQLSSEPELRVRYATAARELIVDQFSKEAKTNQFLQLFDQLSRAKR